MSNVGGATPLATPARVIFAMVTVWTIFAAWYLNLEAALGRSAGVIALALTAAGTTVATVVWGARFLRRLTEYARTALTGWGSLTWVVVVTAAGLVARLVWALTFEVPLLSDHAAYFGLAERLYTEGIYEDRRGDRAYWPPGLPFFLLASFTMVGVKSWVPVAGNLIFYVVTSVATYRIGQLMLGEAAGRLAVLLLAVWPNYVFSTGLASKEMLLTALLPVGLLLYLRATDPTVRGLASDGRLLCSGVVFGMASLVNPSYMLFPGVLVGHALLRRDRLLLSARRIAIVTVGLAAIITPWTVRNMQVLNAFVPVSTNGGGGFYRANNPLATGGFTPAGEHGNLRNLGEVEMNRTGWRLGLDWIRAHPDRFLALAVRKQLRFLGDDGQGAAETLKRGRGHSPRYFVAKGLSNLYWLGVWALILLALRLSPRLYQTPAVLLLALGFLYLFAIHSVFEAGARHHVPVMGFLAILASGVTGPVATTRSGCA